MNDVASLSRYARIAHFLLKYRKAGVFSGFALDEAALAAEAEGAADAGGGAEPLQFVRDLEALGPAFIKVGQTLSTRPDLVPAEYIAALERMQDDVAPISAEDARAVIESELGVRVNRAFASFDDTPLAAASLGQVHAATLRSGRRVAVKVQRPGIVDTIRTDLDLMARVAGTFDRVTQQGQLYRFADWVGEFRKTLLAELDFRLEADNLERFAANLAEYPGLFVPLPVRDYSAMRVLTMEMVDGNKVTIGADLRRLEQPLGELADQLMRGYLDQVFVHGLIHADPHPGNAMLMPDGRLALVDLGMVAHVPPKMRDKLLKLLLAAVDGRGEDAAEVCATLGTRLEQFDHGTFAREAGRLIARYHEQHAGGTMSEGRLVLEITRVGAACGLRPPPELPLLGKTLLNLESVATALDPKLDVKSLVEEHLHKVMQRRLLQALSPSNLASELLETQELVREMPRRIYTILRTLADNRFRVHVAGLEESRLMENMQKIANRVSTGIIAGSLIIGGALMMRVETQATLFGYPALALLMFMLGAGLGLAIVASAWLRDRQAKPQEEKDPI